jgi:Protein of unknown function (DUF4058)
MPSPFPGMNPYLEQDAVWHDFHERFLPLAAELLTPQIRPTFIAKLDEHIYIHELPASQRMLVGRADVGVVRGEQSESSAPVATNLLAPSIVQIPIAVDEQREAFVEIRDRQTRELVTVIELLSPSNKRPGPDREQYLAKRRRLFASWVNLVEIDLLRAGPRLPMEDLQPCDYYALVSRYGDRPRAGVWPIRLHEPLPKVPIPLRAPHADASLDLQQMVHRLYDAAGYEDYIYSGEPEPPLAPGDAAWARSLIPPK